MLLIASSQERKYVFINFRRSIDHVKYHGKAINLNAVDRHAPFPAALLIHEQRARGFCPFNQEPDDIPETIQFQDWISKDIKGSTTGSNVIGNQGPSNFAVPENSSAGGLAPLSEAASPIKSTHYRGHPHRYSGICIVESLCARRDVLERYCGRKY